MKSRAAQWTSIFAVLVAVFAALTLTVPVEAQTASGEINKVKVLVADYGDAGSTFTVTWRDAQECGAGHNVFIDGVDVDMTSLPDGAVARDSGRIYMGSAGSDDTLLTVSFSAIRANSGDGTLTVLVFCNDNIERFVGSVSDIPVDSDTLRPVPGTYVSRSSTSGLQPGGAIAFDGTLQTSGSSNLLVATRQGDIVAGGGQGGDDDSGFFAGKGQGGLVQTFVWKVLTEDNTEETHSSISTTIADSGSTGSTFTITWVDAETCTGDYNLYLDNIDSDGVGLPSGATRDSDGRVHLGAVAATTDPLQEVSTFSTVKAVSDGDHIALWIYCGDDDTGSKVESDELPVDSTSLRPVAGTYSSAPGITELQINGTVPSAFDPYKTHEEYTYIWNVGEADEATINLTLNDGYSATYYGSTKTVYSLAADGYDLGKYAVWRINDTVITDADSTEDDFQLEFDDNDPNGTDWFLLSVSRGDYHTGHQYLFFVIREAAVAGSAMVDYAENGTDAVGTYSISDPARNYSWEQLRPGQARYEEYLLFAGDDENDRDAFIISRNNDGNGVLSFASSPDYEAPTDSSSPPDNVYHTAVLGWEVNPYLGYWYGNYYGLLDVQVTVTDVEE